MYLLQSSLHTPRISFLCLFLCFRTLLGQTASADEVEVLRSPFQIVRDDSRIEVRDGSRPVLAFQFGSRELSQPKAFRRAHYVHPLYSLDGEILTEDFPADHKHHRGIFWSWHQVTVDGRAAGDAWLCRDFQWESKSVEATVSENTAQIRAAAIWRSPAIVDDEGKPVAIASDSVSVSIHPIVNDRRDIDFEISLQALVPSVRIGGSDDPKGYGGFSTRLRMPDDLQFQSEAGFIEPDKLAVVAGRWMVFRSDHFSYAILAHRENPGLAQRENPGLTQRENPGLTNKENPVESNQWILRRKRSMQNSVFPGRHSVPLSQDQATVLRYRLVVFDGQPQSEVDFSELLREFDGSSGD